MQNLRDSDVYEEVEPQSPQDLEDLLNRLPDDAGLVRPEPVWTRLVNAFRAVVTRLGHKIVNKERRPK